MNWYLNIKMAQQYSGILYHATYMSLWDKISTEGLMSPVFLAQDYYQAEAFAEDAVGTSGIEKNIPDNWFDNIIVLGVDTNDLDMSRLEVDPYLRVEEESHKTFIYNSIIPPNIIKML